MLYCTGSFCRDKPAAELVLYKNLCRESFDEVFAMTTTTSRHRRRCETAQWYDDGFVLGKDVPSWMNIEWQLKLSR